MVHDCSDSSIAAIRVCPARFCIFLRLPRCAYSYTLRIASAMMLSSSTGTCGWNGCRNGCRWSSLRALVGSMDESGISSSFSMVSKADCAKNCAYFLLNSVDSCDW